MARRDRKLTESFEKHNDPNYVPGFWWVIIFILYQEDVNYAAVPAIDALQEYLRSKGIDTAHPINVDLIENKLHDIINKFIEEHYAIGDFRHHH